MAVEQAGPPVDLAGTGVSGLEFVDVTATPKTKEEIVAALSGTSGGLGDAISGLFSGLINNIGTVGAGAGGMAAIKSAYDRLGSVGQQALTGAGNIASMGLTQSQFQPFTVKTGMGGTAAVDQFGGIDLSSGRGDQIGGDLLGIASQRFGTAPTGTTALGGAGTEAIAAGRAGLGASPFGLSQQEQAARQAFGLGGQFMGQAGMPMAGREQDIYGRIRAMQTPEEERQRLALEERLANQGRLGVRTAMFGGTPEQLALSKAQEEAQDRAALLAMQQAQQEQRQAADIGATYGQLGSNIATQRQALDAARQLQALQALQSGQNLLTGRMGLQEAQQRLGLGALTGAYIPQAQTLNALQQGLLASQLAQRGQLYGAGLFGEASMGGLEALLGSALGQANLMGNVGTGLLSGALQGSGGGEGGLVSVISDAAGGFLGDAGDALLDVIFGG